MRYKVPQNVQREDQILWFITLRQLIILLVGFGISYTILVKTKEKYDLDLGDQIWIWTPAGIASAIAFLKIRGIELIQFLTLIIENLFFRKARRYWIQNSGEPFTSMTTHVESLSAKKKEKIAPKLFDHDKAKALAEFLDQQGSANEKQFSSNS